MNENWIAITGVSVLVAFIVYRRVRRLFFRQRYSPVRALIPVVVFGLVTLLLFPILSLTTGFAPSAGIVIGAAFGLYGFRRTVFDRVGNEIYFTPDRYIGSIVLALFVGRLIYRALILGNISELVMSQPDVGGPVPAEFTSSPITVVLLFMLFAYYVTYYVAIWTRGRVLREATAPN